MCPRSVYLDWMETCLICRSCTRIRPFIHCSRLSLPFCPFLHRKLCARIGYVANCLFISTYFPCGINDATGKGCNQFGISQKTWDAKSCALEGVIESFMMMQEIHKPYLATSQYICKWRIPRIHQGNGIVLHPTDFALQTKWMRASALHGTHGTGTSSASSILFGFQGLNPTSSFLLRPQQHKHGWMSSK